MTIRRQYMLPNCTLILDGLGDFDAFPSNSNNSRPLMSTLVNAECHLAGQAQSISGGLEFLKHLIAAVSNYTQKFLSSLTHLHLAQQDGSVRLEKGSLEHQHRLITQGERAVDWQFSTVQLFDLVEAIDQFLADGMTLPDLAVALRPAPKSGSGQLIAQTAPVGIGLAGLAATALVAYMLPVPQLTPPVTTSPTPQFSPSAEASSAPSPAPDDAKINSNATQVDFIKRKLRRELNQQWTNRKGIANKLEYRIQADPSGKILNYQPANVNTNGNDALTPLPKLVPNPSKSDAKNLANYKVGFTPNGALEIASFYLLKQEPTLGKTITDSTKVQELVAQVNSQVQLQGKPTFKTNLAYRVAADENGKIVDYEPVNEVSNQAAFDYEKETPLPTITQYDEQAAAGQKPLAQYRVTYQPNGIAKVEPWK